MTIIEQALGEAGVEVTTATTDDDGHGRRLGAFIKTTRVSGAARVYARKWVEFYKVAPGMVPWLWRHVRDFDVVHIHALFSFASVVAGVIARWRGVPYIVRPLGTLNVYGITERRPWPKRLSLAMLERRILRDAAAVHFTTQAEWNEAKLLNIPFRGAIIPLGVEKAELPEGYDLLREYPQLRDRRVLLYLSRLDPKKNVEGLLRAFAALGPQHGDTVLLIAGDGASAYVASLVTLAEALGVGPRVVWLGHVQAARKAAAFAAAHVFVLPSMSENFGIAAVEAMLAGLPCVMGRGVAVAQEAQEVGAGMAVDPDFRSIAQALERLLDDDALRCELSRRGRQFAEQKYSVEVMAARLIGLYRYLAPVEAEA
jgi:glycosyltransferase involved in cell wall biosynthesis